MIKSNWKVATIIYITLIVICSSLFWYFSRIPDLNGKIDEVGFTGFIDVLSNRPIFRPSENSSDIEKMKIAFINWAITNKNGMLFGIFIASLFLALFSTLTIQRNVLKNWITSSLGTALGMPLGLCVNCAAPIVGSSLSSRSILLSLSILLSSPNLNIIILPLSLNLLPFNIIFTKILFTILLIFILLPNLVRNESFKKKLKSENPFLFNPSFKTKNVKELIKITYQSLYFISKKTVPLMFLAGVIASVISVLFPLQNFGTFGWISVFPVAIISTFLPVPVTFDVVLVNQFIENGIPLYIAGTMYYGLSSFSIYAFVIVGNFISYRLAIKIFILTILFSILSGLTLEFSHKKEINNFTLLNNNSPIKIKFSSSKFPNGVTFISEKKNMNIDSFNVVIRKIKHVSKKEYDRDFYDLSNFGIQINTSSILRFAEPELGTVKVLSSGDLNGDYLEEILIADEQEIKLVFMNNSGVWTDIKLPPPPGRPLVGGLVDINNDGLLDVIMTSFFEGTYININQGEHFADFWTLIPNTKNRITGSLSFYDFDFDGFVDIHFANSSLALYRNFKQEVLIHQNQLALNKQLKFQTILSKEDVPGETLANLISDTNNDGKVEIIQANDFSNYSGIVSFESDNTLKRVDLQHVRNLIGSGMSVDSSDVNNDGKIETLIVGSHPVPRGLDVRYRSQNENDVCDYWLDEKQRKRCRKAIFFDILFSNYKKRLAKISNCENFKDHEEFFFQCNEIINLWNNNHLQDENKCQLINIPFLKGLCMFQMNKDEFKVEDPIYGDPRTSHGENALYFSKQKIWDTELAKEFGLKHSCWAWGGKFSDLNNDGYEDLVITNGFKGISGIPCRTLNYINNAGKKFDLSSVNPVSGASAVLLGDFDFDGDIDQIQGGAFIPYIFVANNERSQNLSFDFYIQGKQTQLIGTKVFFEDNEGNKYVRELHLGDGYTSIQSIRQYLGTNGRAINRISMHLSNEKTIEIKDQFNPGYHYHIDITSPDPLKQGKHP